MREWAFFFEDTSAGLGIDDVSSPDFQSRFAPLGQIRQTFDKTGSSFWIRITLQIGKRGTPGRKQADWVLYNWSWFLDKLELYTPQDGCGRASGVWQRTVTGRDFLWETQGLLFCPNVLPLDLPEEGPVTLYLCISSSPSMMIQPSIESQASFQNTSSHLLAAHSGFLGLISGFMIYSLFMWAIARESIYLYAAVYMFFGLLSSLNYRGPQIPLLSSYPPVVSDYVRRLSWVFASIVLVLITRKFLRAKEQFPKIDTGLLLLLPLILAPWAGVVVTGKIFPYFHFLRNAVTDFAYIFVIFGAWFAWLKGFKPARYFLTGFSINAVAVFFASSQLFGWIAYSPNNSVLVPNLLHSAAVIFFFLALADKINELKSEKSALIQSERRLKELSHTDGLTGLFNKRYLDSKLKGDVEHALRLDRTLSVLIVDIDHFKSFNDRFGHLEGDTILKLLGSVMRDTVRDGDSACRYGGEEFVVIAPETDQKGALLLAERIRQRFKDSTGELEPPGKYSCTLSAGVAEIRPGDTEQDILKRADETLYLAKSSGRDCVLAWTPRAG